MRSLSGIPFYAWLAAMFPIASIAAQNAGQVQLSWVVLALTAAVAVATLLILIYRAALGDWSKAGLALLATVILFYAYGPISAAIDGYWLDMSDHGSLTAAPALGYKIPWLLSVGMLLAVAAAVTAISRLSRQSTLRIIAPLNLLAALLIAFPVIQALANSSSPRERPQAEMASMDPMAVKPENLPDIYYIVLDGYARADVLSDYYGFDNSKFLGNLESLGLSVVDGGNSNYYWTFLSLAASLNMDYVQQVLHPLRLGTRDPYPAYEAIRDNTVVRYLRQLGYQSIQLQSSWGATMVNPYADSFVSCSSSLFTNEFFRTIVEASWLRALSALASADLARCHETNMETLKSLVPREGPKFVFAHFLLPHHPYLFDRNGRVSGDVTIANQFDFQAKLWEDRSSYLEQLMFVNDRIEDIVAETLANSAKPPIILIHSDHGPQLIEGLGLDEQHRVRLANFAAVYAPGTGPGFFPAGDTPVNYFRRIFNEYFEAGFPLLENQSFFSTFDRPYQLSEVKAL